MAEVIPPKPKPQTQSEIIVQMLRDAGSKGVPNYKFPQRQILQYNARIDELRKDGVNIYCERQVINDKQTGVWVYYINE